jgi:hypothetical protein
MGSSPTELGIIRLKTANTIGLLPVKALLPIKACYPSKSLPLDFP